MSSDVQAVLTRKMLARAIKPGGGMAAGSAGQTQQPITWTSGTCVAQTGSRMRVQLADGTVLDDVPVADHVGTVDAGGTVMMLGVRPGLLVMAAVTGHGGGDGGGPYIPVDDEWPTEEVTVGDPTARRTVRVGYLTDPNTSPDSFRMYDQDGNRLVWQNEWGAWRGTPSLGLKDDSLVRGVARDDLGPTSTGGFIELVQRWWDLDDPRRKAFGVGWRDGNIRRNGVLMSLGYVTAGATSIPAELPAGTIVARVND